MPPFCETILKVAVAISTWRAQVGVGWWGRRGRVGLCDSLETGSGFGEVSRDKVRFISFGSCSLFLTEFAQSIARWRLRRTVHYYLQAEVIWLVPDREKWLAGDVLVEREVLQCAFVTNPENEEIWLVAVKLEAEIGTLGAWCWESRGRFSFVRERPRIASGYGLDLSTIHSCYQPVSNADLNEANYAQAPTRRSLNNSRNEELLRHTYHDDVLPQRRYPLCSREQARGSGWA